MQSLLNSTSFATAQLCQRQRPLLSLALELVASNSEQSFEGALTLGPGSERTWRERHLEK